MTCSCSLYFCEQGGKKIEWYQLVFFFFLSYTEEKSQGSKLSWFWKRALQFKNKNKILYSKGLQAGIKYLE